MCPGRLQILHVTILFFLGRGSVSEVSERVAAAIDGLGSVGLGHVMSAESVDLQCCRICS